MRWIVCGLYMALITWSSLAPGRMFKIVDNGFPHSDKVAHFFMYGFLVLLLRWALAGQLQPNKMQNGQGSAARISLPRLSSAGLGWWLLLGAVGYGAAMEAAQYVLVPNDRSFELGDMAANALGALFFWWLAGRAGEQRPEIGGRKPRVGQL